MERLVNHDGVHNLSAQIERNDVLTDRLQDVWNRWNVGGRGAAPAEKLDITSRDGTGCGQADGTDNPGDEVQGALEVKHHHVVRAHDRAADEVLVDVPASDSTALFIPTVN